MLVGINGSVFNTTNSGTIWNSIISNTTLGLNDIHFSTTTDYWIVGDNGLILKSSNSGASWSSENLDTYASIHHITEFSGIKFIAGEYGLLAKKNNSDPWDFWNKGMNISINWVTFSDGVYGFGVGQYGRIIKTTDGGKAWNDIYNGITGDSFYGADMSDQNNLWLVGDLGVLLHTSNGGINWIQQTTNTINTLLSICFVDGNNGWAVGDLGELIHTTNGGNTWIKQISGTTKLLFGVTFKDINNGWITGEDGLILRTTDGGNSWSQQISTTSNALFYPYFINFNIGFCAGSLGTILKTTNGGNTWSTLVSNTGNNIYVVSGVSENSIWAIGDSGLILHSTNGGLNWFNEYSKTGYDLFGLEVINDTTAFIAGDNGSILVTGYSEYITDIQVDDYIKTEIPTNFILYQNYPNPFNPSTKIKFAIAISDHVTMKIFDVLGEEIETLIEEELSPGIYEINWNASALPTGVYFYRLQVGSFVQTKKTLVLK